MVHFFQKRFWVFILGMLSFGVSQAQEASPSPSTASQVTGSKSSKFMGMDVTYYSGNESVGIKAKDGISSTAKATQARGLGLKLSYLANDKAKIKLSMRRSEARYKDLENVAPNSTKNMTTDTSLHFVSSVTNNFRVGGGFFNFSSKAEETTPMIVSNGVSYGPSLILETDFNIVENLSTEMTAQLGMPTFFKEASKKSGSFAYGLNTEINAGLFYSVVHWQTVGLSVNYRLKRDSFYGSNEQGGTDSTNMQSSFSIPVTLRVQI